MMRMIGGALLAGGAAWLGIQAAAGLGRRVRALEALVQGVRLLRGELCDRGSPLPQALEQLTSLAKGPARVLFARGVTACRTLDRRPFRESWGEFVRQLPDLTPETLHTLEALGEVLGRYDSRYQGEALDRAALRLEEELRRAHQERSRMGRVYQVLGVTGGAFLVILLL